MNMTRRGFLKLMAATPAAIAVASLPAVIVDAIAVQPGIVDVPITAFGRGHLKLDFGDFSVFSNSVDVYKQFPDVQLLGVAMPRKFSTTDFTIGFHTDSMSFREYKALMDLAVPPGGHGNFVPSQCRDILISICNDNQVYEPIGKVYAGYITDIQMTMPSVGDDSVGVSVTIQPGYVEYLQA